MGRAYLIYYVILGTSTTLQFIAAFLAWRLMRVSGLRAPWMALSGALVLMAVRRLLSLIQTTQGSTLPPTIAPEWIALGISSLMVVGIALLTPRIPSIRAAVAEHGSLGHVMENSDNEIYIFHRETLHFLRVNRGARKNLGYTAEELARMTPVDIKPDFGMEEFRELTDSLCTGERDRLNFTTVHERSDGSCYPVEVDLQMATYDREKVFVAVVTDISDRLRAEHALSESEEHFRSVIEVVQDLITVLDHEGQIVYQSPAISRMLGFSAEDRTGKSGFDLLHPDDREAAATTLKAIFENPQRAHAITYRLRHADGGWRTVEAVGTVRRLDGRGPEIVISQRDITERLRVEEQLRHSQKMETIGTLAGGIAHDFNNLLTPILGYTEMLRDVVKDDPSASADLDRVASAAERAQEIVRQILAFGRRTGRQNRTVSLASVVAETTGLLRATLPSSIALDIDADCPECRVKGDSTQLQQILMNLCTNAHHAMDPEGGTLGIELRRINVEEDLDASRLALRAGAYARLRVRDTGKGIAEHDLKRVFEPFFTTKGVGKGTGLGLSVAHGITREHGGELTVSSRVDRGTVFTIWLPLTTDPVEDRTLVGHTRPNGGTGRLLVVDDEPAVRSLIERMLTAAGYDILVAEGPESAWTSFDADPGAFDLVLTDQTMPGRTGLSLAAELKRRRPDIPVLLMTGHSEAVTPESIAEARVDGLLPKPFRRAELLDTIRGHLDRGRDGAEGGLRAPTTSG
jgi:PAS domain S-box-containing protein